MTPANLIQALSAEIRLATAAIKFPTEYMRQPARDNFVKVNVFEQYLPTDLFEETTYFPLVTVELVSLRDDLKDGSTAEVALSCGTYAKEKDAWRDCFHLIEVIRERLLNKRILNQRFRLTGEIILSFPDEQPAPFFFAYLNLQYEIFLPQEILNI